MMMPNTKSSCFPDANLGRPKVKMQNNAANANAIQTNPKNFLIDS
jgi:hypothetical protein